MTFILKGNHCIASDLYLEDARLASWPGHWRFWSSLSFSQYRLANGEPG